MLRLFRGSRLLPPRKVGRVGGFGHFGWGFWRSRRLVRSRTARLVGRRSEGHRRGMAAVGLEEHLGRGGRGWVAGCESVGGVYMEGVMLEATATANTSASLPLLPPLPPLTSRKKRAGVNQQEGVSRGCDEQVQRLQPPAPPSSPVALTTTCHRHYTITAIAYRVEQQ